MIDRRRHLAALNQKAWQAAKINGVYGRALQPEPNALQDMLTSDATLAPHAQQAAQHIALQAAQEPAPYVEKAQSAADAAAELLVQFKTLNDAELVAHVAKAFPEIERLKHATVRHTPDISMSSDPYPEYVKSCSRIALLRSLVVGDYARFIQGQSGTKTLSFETFQKLQAFAERALCVDEAKKALFELLETAVTYLALFSMGKIPALGDRAQHIGGIVSANPDAILGYTFDKASQTVPSLLRLPASRRAELIDVLKSGFNFGRFLQGEDLRSSTFGLRSIPPSLLNLVCLHGIIIVGAAQGTGPASPVLTEDVVGACLEATEAICKTPNENAYDVFHARRCERFNLNYRVPRERALERLIGMYRAWRQSEVDDITRVFDSLADDVQLQLVEELCITGAAEDMGVLLHYAPSMLTNARALQGGEQGIAAGLVMLSQAYAKARLWIAHQSGPGVFSLDIKALADSARRGAVGADEIEATILSDKAVRVPRKTAQQASYVPREAEDALRYYFHRERCRVLFQQLEKDGSGVLSNEQEAQIRKALDAMPFDLPPQVWREQARQRLLGVLGDDSDTLKARLETPLWESARFNLNVSIKPSLETKYAQGEPIADAVRHVDVKAVHTIGDVAKYLDNRMGKTIQKLILDAKTDTEIFLGPGDDLSSYYVTRGYNLVGDLSGRTSSRFVLFEANGTRELLVAVTGIDNISRFNHQLLQLKFSGLDLDRIRVRGTLAMLTAANSVSLKETLASLVVRPEILIVGQRWWPMEHLAMMAGMCPVDGVEGDGYNLLQPRSFQVGPFGFDLITVVKNGKRTGLAALRMPNGNLAGDAVGAFLEAGTLAVVLIGAGGAIKQQDSHGSGLGDYQIIGTSTYHGKTEIVHKDAALFDVAQNRIFDGVAVRVGTHHVTVDSPLEESQAWFEDAKTNGYGAVDVETWHILQAFNKAKAKGSRAKILAGLFNSDVVGSHPLEDKIAVDNAYGALPQFMRLCAEGLKLDAVFDAKGRRYPLRVRSAVGAEGGVHNRADAKRRLVQMQVPDNVSTAVVNRLVRGLDASKVQLVLPKTASVPFQRALAKRGFYVVLADVRRKR